MKPTSLLRERDFRLVAGAVGLSAFGDWVAIVALGLYVKETTESGFGVAALWICLFGPSVAVAAHAGLLVDRVETTRLLAGASLLGALVAAVLGFAGAPGLVLGLTALLGLVFAVLGPAEFALVPLLAGQRVHEANGHVETARYVGFGLGPLVGGLLFSIGGLELAMLVDAATFLAVAGAAAALRVRRDPGARDAEHPPRARDGIAFLWRDRVLKLGMLVAFSSLLFMSAVWVGELFFVDDVLGRGDVAYGLMLSIWTAGHGAGSHAGVAAGRPPARWRPPAWPRSPSRARRWRSRALWLSFGFFLACSLIGGLAHGVKNVMFRSLIHVRVPDPLHGRVFAAYNGIRNSAELGAFAAGGLLVVAIGPRATLAYAGGLSALAGLVGLLVLLRMYRGWVPTGPIGPLAATPPRELEPPAPARPAPEVDVPARPARPAAGR